MSRDSKNSSTVPVNCPSYYKGCKRVISTLTRGCYQGDKQALTSAWDFSRTESRRDIWMLKGIWQPSAVAVPQSMLRYLPRSYETHFSLQQNPAEIHTNVLNTLGHIHAFWVLLDQLVGQIRGADFMRVSGNSVLTSPFLQTNIFTPQRMAKFASYAQSHFCKRKQSSWPQVTMQSQQSTGEV